MWHDRRIINEVAALRLPDPNSVVINHGAALVIRGVRVEHPDGDIDIATSLENIQYLRELGWQALYKIAGHDTEGRALHVLATQDPSRRFDVHRRDFSLVGGLTGKRKWMSVYEQRCDSDQDPETGIWVASLRHVRETKLGSMRPKDIEDIQYIDAYLRN